MQRILSLVSIAALAGLLLGSNVAHAQKVLLKTDGWGSISGKVTLEGNGIDLLEKTKKDSDDLLAKMKIHANKACCLAPAAKPIEKIDTLWIVNPKTKAVANVIVWVSPPKGTYFPMHPSYLKRKDHVVIDQPHCAFLPRISAYNPEYFDGKKMVSTGQKIIIKNSAVVPHNVRLIGVKNAFNKILPPSSELEPDLEPEKLPVVLRCDIHTWMSARLLVCDHPYYAITKEDGTFTIPFVPAGAEITVVGWHEEPGYVLAPGKKMVTAENKKTTVVNFSVVK